MLPGVELVIANKKANEADFWEYQIRVKMNDDDGKLAKPFVDVVHPKWHTFDYEPLVNWDAEQEILLKSVLVEIPNSPLRRVGTTGSIFVSNKIRTDHIT